MESINAGLQSGWGVLVAIAPLVLVMVIVRWMDEYTDVPPLRTLSEYRRWDGKVWFAINLVHAREHIGLKQLYVFISTDNVACLRLFEHHGYREVGVVNSWVKRGQNYQDVVLMQMIL